MAGGGQSSPSSTTTTQELPAFLEAAYQKAIDRADAASQEQTPIYQGQRIANTTVPTQQAMDLTDYNVGRFDPTYNAGVNMTTNAGKLFDPNEFASFQNPYQSSVVDEIGRLANRDFTENKMPVLNSQFTGNGMFGSSRNAEILGRAARDVQDDTTGKQAELLNTGFQESMKNYLASKQNELAAGNQLGNQAVQGQGMAGNDINALYKSGDIQQGQEQKGLDTAYNTFLEQRDAPKNNIKFFSDIAHGTSPQGLITSTTSSNQNGNNLVSALGAAATTASIGKTVGAFAKGGLVKPKKKPVKKKLSASNIASAPAMFKPGLGGLSYG